MRPLRGCLVPGLAALIVALRVLVAVLALVRCGGTRFVVASAGLDLPRGRRIPDARRGRRDGCSGCALLSAGALSVRARELCGCAAGPRCACTAACCGARYRRRSGADALRCRLAVRRMGSRPRGGRTDDGCADRCGDPRDAGDSVAAGGAVTTGVATRSGGAAEGRITTGVGTRSGGGADGLVTTGVGTRSGGAVRGRVHHGRRHALRRRGRGRFRLRAGLAIAALGLFA